MSTKTLDTVRWPIVGKANENHIPCLLSTERQGEHAEDGGGRGHQDRPGISCTANGDRLPADSPLAA
ncbi:MAG: hypothetical protein ONB17_07800 [candidate division KSB1 bacterium]|nr:hypothetical protein [candidate division KSB1 bacterium]MDZ7393151.1 hypothetical protein [candidate division KSB1 bacterium]